MARRKKRKVDPQLAAIRRQHLREALPPGATLEDMGDLCRAVHPKDFGFGCKNETHSLGLTIHIIDNSEYCGQCTRQAVLEWLSSLGGVCDCTIHTKALRRVLRLSKDLWE